MYMDLQIYATFQRNANMDCMLAIECDNNFIIYNL